MEEWSQERFQNLISCFSFSIPIEGNIVLGYNQCWAYITVLDSNWVYVMEILHFFDTSRARVFEDMFCF